MSTSIMQCYWFIFKGEQLLLNKDNTNLPLSAPLDDSLQSLLIRQIPLLQLDYLSAFCAEIEENCHVPDTLVAIPLRQALDLLGADWYNMTTKAIGIINWDKNHQFCGRCGSLTEQRNLSFERTCPLCHLAFYPRISPSVVVLIQRDRQILMARGPHFKPGAYGLIAGFVEPGESAEEAAHREVQEEVGIQIKNLRYFSSQAWPFPDSLMIAFIADYASGELCLDPTEIEDAGWYDYHQLPGLPSYKSSLTYKLINTFIAAQSLKS